MFYLQLNVREAIDQTDCSEATKTPATRTTFKSLSNKRSIHKTEATLTATSGDQLQFALSVQMEQGLHFTEGAPSQAQLLIYGIQSCTSLKFVNCISNQLIVFLSDFESNELLPELIPPLQNLSEGNASVVFSLTCPQQVRHVIYHPHKRRV